MVTSLDLHLSTVQHHKWIGNWDSGNSYKRYNRVTKDHVEYRAVLDNTGMDPSLNSVAKSYSLYNAEYPPPAPQVLQFVAGYHDRIGYSILPNFTGKFTHIKIYKPAENTSTEMVIMLWVYKDDGLRVYKNYHTQTSPVTASGWQTIELTTPIAVTYGEGAIICYEPAGQPIGYVPERSILEGTVDPSVYTFGAYPASQVIMHSMAVGHSYEGFYEPVMNSSNGWAWLMDFVYQVDVAWEVVLNARPDTVYEAAAQAITNKTLIQTSDAVNIQQSEIPSIGDAAFDTYNLKYLVGIGPENEARWISDLAASKQCCARDQLIYRPGASAGKVLICSEILVWPNGELLC